MTLHLHDTLRGKKVPFEPLKDGEVTMYLCGPTVYNYAHIAVFKRFERNRWSRPCATESGGCGCNNALHLS